MVDLIRGSLVTFGAGKLTILYAIGIPAKEFSSGFLRNELFRLMCVIVKSILRDGINVEQGGKAIKDEANEHKSY